MRAVDRDHVHAGEHLVEAFPVGRLQLLLDGGGDAAAVVVVDRQAEGLGASCQGLADATHADDAQALAGDAAAEHPGRRPAGPVTSRDHLGALDEAPGDGENQRHGHVRRVLGEDPGRVGDGDASFRGRVDVDVVDAVAEVGDELHLLARRPDDLGVDPVGNRRHQHIGRLQGLHQLRTAHWPVGVVQARVEQFAHARFDHVRKLARHDDRRLLAAHQCLSPRDAGPGAGACKFTKP